MRILIAGGGTGGHINPAVAIANAAKDRYENCEILFVGTERGLEKKLVPEAGYNIEFIECEGFVRKFTTRNIRVAAKTLKGYLRSRKIIKKFKPDVAVGTGGYVSGPVIMAAHNLKIPTVIHEQNALAGITSKILSRYVDKICLAFNDKNMLGYPEKSVVTGNPVRNTFKNIKTEECKKLLAVDDGRPFVLCVSGSLGAEKINDCMLDYARNRGKDINYHLLIVTGERYFESAGEKLKDIGNPYIHIKKYIFDIEKYLGAADLVISRAGAIFLSEIAYLGKPSVLIPSPNVAENHQEFNADMFVKAGCSVKIKESELSSEKMGQTLENLIGDEKKLKAMAESSYKYGIRNGDSAILDVIDSLIHL